MKTINQIKEEATQTSIPIMMDEGMSFILDFIKKMTWNSFWKLELRWVILP